MQTFSSPRAGGASVHVALVAPLAPGVAAAARQRVVAEKLPLALLDASVVPWKGQVLNGTLHAADAPEPDGRCRSPRRRRTC